MKRQRDVDVQRRAQGYDAAVLLVDKIQRGASCEDTIDAATRVLRALKDAEDRVLQLTCVVAASAPPPATISASSGSPHQMPPTRVGQLLAARTTWLEEITHTPTTFQSCSAGLSGSLSKQISHVEGEFRKVRQQAEALSGIGVNHPLWDAPTVRGILERPAVDDNNVTYVRRPAKQAVPRWNCDTMALCLS
jgi:hypothetical protein